MMLLGAACAALVAGASVYAFGPTFNAAPEKAKTPPLPASALMGPASVIDGDTINIRGQRIRLHGIDAPESAQSCRDGQGRDYRCGQKATSALAEKIGKQTVSCEQRDIDRYKRVVAVCRAGEGGAYYRPAELSLKAKDTVETPLLPGFSLPLSDIFG